MFSYRSEESLVLSLRWRSRLISYLGLSEQALFGLFGHHCHVYETTGDVKLSCA